MNYLDQIEAEHNERAKVEATFRQIAKRNAARESLMDTVKAAINPDDETDQRYEVHVASDQGKSRIYIMATSVAEVKRAMKHKPGYVVLAIKAMIGSMSANMEDLVDIPEVSHPSEWARANLSDPSAWQAPA